MLRYCLYRTFIYRFCILALITSPGIYNCRIFFKEEIMRRRINHINMLFWMITHSDHLYNTIYLSRQTYDIIRLPLTEEFICSATLLRRAISDTNINTLQSESVNILYRESYDLYQLQWKINIRKNISYSYTKYDPNITQELSIVN